MSDERYPKPPSHRTFSFGPIIIDSDFDSGNCSHAQKISYLSVTLMATQYEIWIGTDNPKNNYRTWFYFSAAGFNQGSTVSFKLKNMQNQSKLLTEGLVPVYREQSSQQWKRVRERINLSSIEYNQGWIEWSFKHTFANAQKVFFAFFYPWSNQDNNQYLDRIEEKAKQIPNIYFYRSSIVASLQGRNLQFLVISSNLHKTNKQQRIQDKALFEGRRKPHAFNQNKKGIVISARVHPGQLPGSHVMTGIIDELTDDNEKARILRDNFVFYIFPILNPDGVARGHYRVDTNGINLNRCYINPTMKFQPTIYAVRNFILHLSSSNRFFAFLDLHAHASRRGTFIYGNSVNQLQKQVQTCLFPKILSLNSPDFQYEGSNFTEQNMYCKEKGDHMSKEGSGRVAIYKATKNPFCWTLQCNYNMSKTNNILEPRRPEGTKYSKPHQNQLNSKLILSFRSPPQRDSTEFFTMNTFKKLGKQICQSFLDLIEKNPESRIDNPNNYFQSVQNLKMNLAIALLRMAPSRFQPHFRKIFTSASSENSQIVNRALQALYLLLIKNAKISNINTFIKDGDMSTVVVQSPKKTKSASFAQPKFSSLLERSNMRNSKVEVQPQWKSQKNIQKCSLDILDFRVPNRQSLYLEPEINWTDKRSIQLEDKIQNIICEKLKLYQIQMRSHRTTSLRIQNTKTGEKIGNNQQKQRALSPLKTKLKIGEAEFPVLKKKSSLGTQDSSKKNAYRGDFVRDPLLFVQTS